MALESCQIESEPASNQNRIRAPVRGRGARSARGAGITAAIGGSRCPVAHEHDAGAERPGLHEPQPRDIGGVGEQSLAVPEHDRVDE